MTDDSSSTEPGPSAWDLEHDDESSTDEDFFSTLKQRVARHVYFDNELPAAQPTPTTTSASDLLARCRAFLPLLTDANRVLRSKIDSGENVRIELDSSDEEDGEAIEMNLMFCPNEESSSSSSDEDDEETPPKKPLVNIVELSSEERTVEENVDS